MAVPMRWRIKDLGAVWVHKESGDLVITGEEKHRGRVGVTIAASEARWLLASLQDLERQGLLGETAGQSQGAYGVESLSVPR